MPLEITFGFKIKGVFLNDVMVFIRNFVLSPFYYVQLCSTELNTFFFLLFAGYVPPELNYSWMTYVFLKTLSGFSLITQRVMSPLTSYEVLSYHLKLKFLEDIHYFSPEKNQLNCWLCKNKLLFGIENLYKDMSSFMNSPLK